MIMREELYHPMLAHFPIVLLFLALILKSLEIAFIKNSHLSDRMNFFARIVLFSAPLLYLITMYLGDAAFEIIKKDFCHLKLIYDHEELSKLALVFIMLATVLEALSKIESITKKMRTALSILTLVTLITVNGLVFKTAHSGAMLVYDHAAAVRGARNDCR